MRRLTVALAGSLALASSAGCSRPTDEQPRSGACATFEIVESAPAALSAAVPTNTDIRLTFSGYPDPDTIDGNDVILSSGLFTRFGRYDVDLLARQVRFTPLNPLTADITYVVTVLPDVRSLQGCATHEQQLKFQSGDGPMARPDPPPPPAFTADVLPVLAASCGGGGCHRQSPNDGGGCLAAPAKGLSLCDADAFAALVGAPSQELVAMDRVAASDPSRSYLLRKLIAPDDAPIVPGTLGELMPPGLPLEGAQLRLISDWIAGGAPR